MKVDPSIKDSSRLAFLPVTDSTKSRDDNFGRIPALDGLRVLAVIMVIFHHVFHFLRPLPLSWTGPNAIFRLFAQISEYGYFGVDLFFVISGFLITRILLRLRQDGGGVKEFYIRRVLRIFP